MPRTKSRANKARARADEEVHPADEARRRIAEEDFRSLFHRAREDDETGAGAGRAVADFFLNLERSGREVVKAALSLGCNEEEMAIALGVVDTRLPRTALRAGSPRERPKVPIRPG